MARISLGVSFAWIRLAAAGSNRSSTRASQPAPCRTADRRSRARRGSEGCGAPIALVVARTVVAPRRDDIDTVVRHARPLRGARLRRTDLQVAIHRDRI